MYHTKLYWLLGWIACVSCSCSGEMPYEDAKTHSTPGESQRPIKRPKSVSVLNELFLESADFAPSELGKGFSACARIEDQPELSAILMPWPDDLRAFLETHLSQFPDQSLLLKSLQGIFLARGAYLQYEDATGGSVTGLMCDTEHGANYIFLNYDTFVEERSLLGPLGQWHNLVGVIDRYILTTHGDQLIFTLLHEIFHAIDHSRYLATDGSIERQAFADLSWLDSKVSRHGDQEIFSLSHAGPMACARRSSEFFNLDTMNSHQLASAYKKLAEETSFISPYAATNPYEDFADTLATYYFLRVYENSLVRDVYEHGLMQKSPENNTMLYRFNTRSILEKSKMQRTKLCRAAQMLFDDPDCLDRWVATDH